MKVRAKHWIKTEFGWFPAGTEFAVDEDAFSALSASVDVVEQKESSPKPSLSEPTDSEPTEVPKKRGRKKTN